MSGSPPVRALGTGNIPQSHWEPVVWAKKHQDDRQAVLIEGERKH
jgi:hypothetical protein